MRVFFDTNVLVSAFTARGLSADVFRLALLEHELLTGELNLQELDRVLTRRLRAPTEVVSDALDLLREQTVVPLPSAPSEIEIRDVDDRWVLASAVDGDADVLVTGDRDLLILGDEAPIRIVTPRGFWELVRRGG